MVCAPPPNITVEVSAVNTDPVPVQAVALVAFSFKVLDPPFNVPAVSVTTPEKVCVKPTPKLSVPPEPFIVNAAPLRLPAAIATPEVLDMVTLPVVVNEPIRWVAVPEIVTPPEPVKVPLLIKLP